ncbi:MAG TPA: TonB-dependent receptor [Xanthomonadaceae bacterium]|nr:TonB-dependent receptor [Xanthomonadaceae bacterium]
MGKRIRLGRLAGSVSRALHVNAAGLPALSMAVLVGAGAFAGQARANGADSPSGEDKAKTLDTVTVISTGTRKADMAVTDSPAPIQLVSTELLKQTAAPDLMNAIANQVPSYNANQVGGDMASQTLTASLRGLTANHTLILVNGKRRHVTSNFGVAGSGEMATDLSYIPTSAIDHVEVLTDGAAALYGSDAIAGVINIILKKNHEGGEVNAGYAGYADGGGGTDSWSGNIGLGGENGFVSISAEVENRMSVYRFSNPSYANCLLDIAACQAYATANGRGDLLSRIANDQGALLNSRFPGLNAWLNPPEVHRKVAMFNAGYSFENGVDFYAFGSYGKKSASSEENYRRPSQDGGYTDPVTGEVKHKYALGFNPSEASEEYDYDLTAGLKGDAAGWLWDVSTSYGRNQMDVYTRNTMNFSLWQDYGYSPESFYDGTFYSTQWTTDASVTKDFDVGLSSPMIFNAGVEYRRDGYGIEAGEPTSYYGAGASSFPGYNPLGAGDYSRHSYAVFADVVFNPTDKWLIDVAGRYENFSDFGSKSVGKFTTRYDFTDAFAVRGTFSTGFRAPNMGENYYTAIQVSPTGATATLAGSSIGSGLKPETSKNLSLGFVFKPIENLTSTLDFYQIKISDRTTIGSFSYSQAQSAATVTGRTTGTWNADLPDPADSNGDGVPDDSYNQILGEALVAGGFISQWNDPTAPGGSFDQTARANINLSFFTNALDTKTSGVDWVTNYTTGFDWGSIDWLLAANYNKTEVTRAGRAAGFESIPLFTGASVYNIEHASPKFRVNLAATFNWQKFTLTLRESIYGPQTQVSSLSGYESLAGQLDTIQLDGGDYYKLKIETMATTGFDLSFKPNDSWTLSVGGDNVFNKYPDKIPSAVWNYDVANYQNGNNQYIASSDYAGFTGSPIGYFGARYYAKLTYRF